MNWKRQVYGTKLRRSGGDLEHNRALIIIQSQNIPRRPVIDQIAEEPLVSEDEVQACSADGERVDPLLVAVPVLRVGHVDRKLKSFTLEEIPVTKGGGRLRGHQGSLEPRRVPVVVLHDPGQFHLEEASRRDVHVNCTSLFLEIILNGCSIFFETIHLF